MRRFFVADIDEDSERVSIKGAEFTHLKKVLRLRAGNAVAVFNGRGLELTGVIESVGADSASVKIEGRSTAGKESPVDIILLQGLVKGEKPELIVQKATELGVSEVHFYSTSRTVPVIGEKKSQSKVSRLRKIAVEAAKQCGRSSLPVMSFVGFEEALRRAGTLKLLFWEDEKTVGIKDIFRGHLPSPLVSIIILIGPEGGLSEEDASKAISNGFIPAGLGPRVLRAETAAISAISIVQYELGDMN